MPKAVSSSPTTRLSFSGRAEERRDPRPGDPGYLPRRVLGPAGDAGRAAEGDDRLLQAQPCHHAADEAMLLAQAAQRRHRRAAEQAEVTDLRPEPLVDG